MVCMIMCLEFKLTRLADTVQSYRIGISHAGANMTANACPFQQQSHYTAAGSRLRELSGVHSLSEINLKGCYKLADNGMAELAYLKQLRVLNLQECWQITQTGLQRLSGAQDCSRILACNSVRPVLSRAEFGHQDNCHLSELFKMGVDSS